MSKVNILEIQENLKKVKSVSVPFIQAEYGLNYTQAKEFVKELMKWGWISKEPNGIQYSVNPSNLKLRNIRKEEVDVLFDEINSECIRVLKYIQSKNRNISEAEFIIDVMQEDEDYEAVSLLLKHNLIYRVDDRYFICISTKTVNVLADVVKEKMYSEACDDKNEESTKRIKALFNKLFE